MTEGTDRFSMGWLPDYPDFRDYTPEDNRAPQRASAGGNTRSIRALLAAADAAPVELPNTADVRAWCSPIENQGSLGSCTANAGVGMIEYFERRAFGKHIDASRLFLYKVTRTAMHVTGDTGAFLRTTMGALATFGVPPEEYWPYDVAGFDKEPPAFCYAFAQNYQAVSYYRLDPPGTAKGALLDRIRGNLASGLPSMFGFTVYNSYTQAAANEGKIPVPTAGESVVGGHAVMAVGFDDTMKIKNTNPSGAETVGALLIRNSWGTGWGASGYGWLPYDYVLKGLAVDFWSLLKSEWIDTGNFGR